MMTNNDNKKSPDKTTPKQIISINYKTFHAAEQVAAVYDIVMALLATIAVAVVLLDITGNLHGSLSWIRVLENIIWYIFIVDYFVRLVTSDGKIAFIKSNIFDLISILPFSYLFRMFKFARLFRLSQLSRVTNATRLVKLFVFAGRFSDKVKGFLSSSGLIYVLYINIVVIFLGSIGLYFFESEDVINSFSDAVWLSFATATTVGYGDITPSSVFGRIIAACLMISGIGTVGMLTSSLSAYFIKTRSNEDEKENVPQSDIEELTAEIQRLSPDQIALIKELIKNIKN